MTSDYMQDDLGNWSRRHGPDKSLKPALDLTSGGNIVA